MKLQLSLNVTYNPNGVPEEELRAMMEDIVRRAMGEGMVTQDTEAEVDEYTYTVKRLDGEDAPKQHDVTLSNGERLRLIERDEELAIATVDESDTDWFLGSIDKSGITVYCNSGDENVRLVEGLKK